MDLGLLIDNETVDASDGSTFERKSPVTGEVVSAAAAAKSADVDAAVQSAAKAFPAWSKTGVGTNGENSSEGG